ncbi:hypothetical protein SLITO_v1c03800 [Spiroplasma litorale]|uniref:Uncharacterized protein n=1 Tax=Spiroplasma litorale TaxID=216942 RepID=A0A0K1W1I5_9MOLU|nr:hypothetical protein [Spiroplasma litorale]AKX34033.1 hypothetical protein SLITO_v1c03800 [Spiroplasma litorale]
MIEYFKTFKIVDNDVNNLKNVRPFWTKEVSKSINKLKKWKVKFKHLSNFELEVPEKYGDYPEFIKQISNYNNFLNQKSKDIKSDIKIYSKLYKIFCDYSYILGWVKFIEIVCKFYEDLKYKEVSNKMEYFLDLVNKTLFSFFEIYKKNMYTLTENDDYIKLLLDNVAIPNKNIFVVNDILGNLLKYSKTLFRKKKVNDAIYIKIASSTLELVNFNYSFSFFSYNIMKNFY